MPAMAEENPSALESAVTSLSKSIADRLPKNSHVLVSEIHDRDGRLTYLGRYFSEKLRTTFSGNPDYILMERRRSDLILNETFLQEMEPADSTSAARPGTPIGADTIIHGNVFDLEKAIDIDLLIRNAETGQIIGTASQRLKKSDGLASVLHSVLLSERKKNEVELAESDRLQDQVKIAVLEKDNEKLTEVLRTGIWRGGPIFDEAVIVRPSVSTGAGPSSPIFDDSVIVRPSVSTGTWGLWAYGGYMRRFSGWNSSWNLGLGLRTPSGRWESMCDVGSLTSKGSDTEVSGTSDIFVRAYKYSTFFYRARGVYVHKIQHINLPGIVRFRFPASLRFGAGFGLYAINATMDENVKNNAGIQSFYRWTEHFQRVEPMLEFGLSRSLSNVFDVQLSIEHVFSRSTIWKDSFQYGGPSALLRLSYRLF